MVKNYPQDNEQGMLDLLVEIKKNVDLVRGEKLNLPVPHLADFAV